MNGIGKTEVRRAWQQARDAAREARREASRTAYWLGRLPRAGWCALTGRHDWSEWRESTTWIVPPETRRCRRCTGVEYRGKWPAICVEGGSLNPVSPVFRWVEND